MEEKVEMCGLKFSLSYATPIKWIIKKNIKEFKIKVYHAYMNDWTPFIGEHLPTRPEPKDWIDQYVVAVIKDAWVIGHLKKGKTGQYTKTSFHFLRANPMNIADITDKRKRVTYRAGQGLQIRCTISFKVKNISKFF